MNNLSNLLNYWKASDKEVNWVLGTVYKTEGSAYRKAGAHMLINEYGDYYGLLSGGCLESDIVLNARKVMQKKHAQNVPSATLFCDNYFFHMFLNMCQLKIQ